MIGDDPLAGIDEEIAQPTSSSSGHSAHNGDYPTELFTEKISARFRTFFIDVKESSNGRFLKISEKSRGGQRSTIMMDGEDVDTFIEALQKAKAALNS